MGFLFVKNHLAIKKNRPNYWRRLCLSEIIIVYLTNLTVSTLVTLSVVEVIFLSVSDL